MSFLENKLNLSTFIIDQIGLRWTILTSSGLAFSGALMKCLVTFPGFEDGVDKGVQYWVTFVAQCLIGVASPLVFCLPNKVSTRYSKLNY